MADTEDRRAGMHAGLWSSIELVRERLDAGADPDAPLLDGRPLHQAAEWGSAEVVAELASRVPDVDVLDRGRTAWIAVHMRRDDVVEVLQRAGADPWRPMMSGWSPGRLNLSGPHPRLFGEPPSGAELSAADVATVERTHRLLAAMGDPYHDGFSLACVAGISSAEAVRRLAATDLPAGDTEDQIRKYSEGRINDQAQLTVGVTDVPGGCVVTQVWGNGASTPVVGQLLSAGTVCYTMFANPKSGNQGAAYRDGLVEGWDLHPGYDDPREDDSPERIQQMYLCRGQALASCCLHAGLEPIDTRPMLGPADRWVLLPMRDWWAMT